MDDNNFRTNKFPFQDLNPYGFVVIIIVTIFFTYQIVGSVFVFLTFGDKFLESENIFYGRIITIISQFLLILFPVYILNYLTGNSVYTGFSIKKTKISYFLLAAIGILLVQPVLQYYMFLQDRAIDYFPVDSSVIEAIKNISKELDSYTVKLVTAFSTGDLFLIIIAVGLTPAICEELMFRGLILNTLTKTGKIKSSIILTGFFFSIFHFHPFNIVPLFLLGIYLAIITYYSRSIFPAMLVHFLNNLISILAVHFYGKEAIEDYEFIGTNFYSITLFAFVSFILFVFITYYIIIQGKKDLINEQSC